MKLGPFAFFLHVYCIISQMFRYPLETRRHKHFSLSRLLTPLSLKCPRDCREERQSLEESQCLAPGQRPRAVVFWEDRQQSISWERESPSGSCLERTTLKVTLLSLISCGSCDVTASRESTYYLV